MVIIKSQKDKSIKLEFDGRLDTVTSKQLEAEVVSSFKGKTEVIMDFSKLDYLSSAGLRAILLAQKLMNKQGRMKIINVNDTVMEVFEITGFSNILTIE